ncbi:MAG: phospholipase D family protein [Candidatus Micrarchaeota archaeon]|nr:phospholipase D family protein [Candidatus Micrarchaeota archaeon]
MAGALLLSAAILIAISFFIGSLPCAGCNAHVEYVFSPGAESEVISLIRSAQKTIDVEMYVLTSEDIVNELSAAVKRGVKVRVILEPRVEDTRKDKVFQTLRQLGVDMRWASFTYKLTHSKLLIVDGKRALVGSINFSDSALNSNREVAALVEGENVHELTAIFEEDWQKASVG